MDGIAWWGAIGSTIALGIQGASYLLATRGPHRATLERIHSSLLLQQETIHLWRLGADFEGGVNPKRPKTLSPEANRRTISLTETLNNRLRKAVLPAVTAAIDTFEQCDTTRDRVFAELNSELDDDIVDAHWHQYHALLDDASTDNAQALSVVTRALR